MTSKKLVGTLAVMAVAAIAPASAVAAPEARHLEQISMGVKAPAPESLTQARNLNDIEAIDLNALGTQVGSATGLFPLENIQITA